MKKLVSICLSMLMILGITVSVPTTVGAESDDSIQIKIVHTNDIHSRVIEDENSGIIGVPKLKSIIDYYTAEADISLVLDSGDTFHGQSIATLVQGESVAELMKACGYDAMTAGNHDWSYGKDRLKELADMAGVKMLAGNVVNADESQFFTDEFMTKEVTKNGQTLKVGVFGVIDPKIYSSTAPSNVEGLTFTNSAEYAAKAAEKLENEGCDIVIALSHTYNPQELAAQVDGVDLWLCGHEHMDINTSVTTPDGSTAYVIEDGYYLGQVGLVELNCTFDESGELAKFTCEKTACTYNNSSEYEADTAVVELLNDINEEQSVILNETVGSTPVMLDGVWEHLRIDETNLGKAVTNAYLLVTGADIAFENAGGIRASIDAGEVTYGDIISVAPYGNYIVTKQITGKQLKEILETSIDIQIQCIAANDSGEYDAWPDTSGSYLQTGGMTVTYNPSLEKGSRVISVKVGENPLDENKLYTVATNNYAAISSVYPQLAEAEEVGEFCACDEALIKFFGQSEAVVAEAVAERGMIKTDKTSEDVSEPSEEPSETSSETPSEEPSETSSEIPSESKNDENTDAPQTSDSSVVPMYVVMVLMSSAIALVLIKARKNKQV